MEPKVGGPLLFAKVYNVGKKPLYILVENKETAYIWHTCKTLIL